MLTVNNVYKSYDGKPVLRGVSLTLSRGEKLCVMGASGCGKTTLLRLIAGLETPDGGEIVNDMRVGMVFGEDRLIDGLTALGNLTLIGGGQTRERAEEMLGVVGLRDVMHHRAGTLSDGQKRRVAIARALISDAELLLFDEPFKGLDDDIRDTVMAVIDRACESRAAILVTHNKTAARAFLTRGTGDDGAWRDGVMLLENLGAAGE